MGLNATGLEDAATIPANLGRTVPWSIVVMLTVLTLVPSILICMTPFARLLIVFHFLRQALGLSNDTVEPDLDWSVGHPYIFSHAAGCVSDLPGGCGSAAGG